MAHAQHAPQCTASHSAHEYQRRRPEETALYKIIQAYWPEFAERADALGGLPDFIKNEFEAYLECGILEKGFVAVKCPSCGFERLVGFSCKTRGFCPSCVGRRMNDAAAHFVDRVLPLNAIRQWVCTMPFSLRYAMGYDKSLCADILSGYAAQLMRWYKQRAKRLLGLKSINEAHTGAVTIVQRFDSALRLNVHPHTLCLDGVYVRDQSSGLLVFHQLPEPTHQQVEQLAARIAQSSEKVMRKHGRWVDDDSAEMQPEQLSLDYPALSQCYSAALSGVQLLSERAGRPCMRLLSTPPVDNSVQDPGAVAIVRGFNLHGKTRVDGQDRQQLEKLCRYIARPPIAQDRLHILQDGRVRYDMKRIFKDGTKAIVLSPLHFIARLCALVPPPYFHLTRLHGLLAPNSKLRSEVVPQREQLPGPAQQLLLFDANESGTRDKPAIGGRLPWAWLLKRVFRVDITVCPKCQGSLRVTELVIKRDEIAKRLAQQGLGPMPPPAPLPKVRGQLALRFDLE